MPIMVTTTGNSISVIVFIIDSHLFILINETQYKSKSIQVKYIFYNLILAVEVGAAGI